jgi:hypothetical protein
LTGGKFFSEVLLYGFADLRGHAGLEVKFLEPYLVLGISTDALYEIMRKKKDGFSKMPAKAKAFNAKWRLYYDHGAIA